MLEAVVDPTPSGRPPSSLTLHLPGGAHIEVGNVAQAALAFKKKHFSACLDLMRLAIKARTSVGKRWAKS
jgi:hypothetical protein